MTLRIGELCAGYGGLSASVMDALDAAPSWYAEYDPADKHQHSAKILAHRWPGVPNHGDITAADWADVEPVDMLLGGYPCQGQSVAGKQLGEDDPRWLWPQVARAVRALRPPLVFFENVRNHLRIGFGTVLGDLDDLGYDVFWTTLKASAVGAPHHRDRLFILGVSRDAERTPSGLLPSRPARFGQPMAVRRDGAWWEPCESLLGPIAFTGELPPAGAVRGGLMAAWSGAAPEVPGGRLLKTPTGNLGSNGGSQHPDKRRSGGHGPTLADELEHLDPRSRRSPAALLPTPRASDGAKGGPNQRGSSGDLMLPSAVTHLAPATAATDCGCAAWGQYQAAIHRWEAIQGRTAPEPTEESSKGNRVLSPAAVEFMMGLPAGWVTAVPGVARNPQLHALGNGVVPMQGAVALRLLLERAGPLAQVPALERAA